MTCDDIKPRLDAYLDDELPPEDRRQVELHLADCPPCAAELSALRRLSAAFAGFRAEMPAALLDRVHDAVDRARGGDRMILRISRAISAVAASIVLAGTFYLTFTTSQQPATPAPISYAYWEQAASGTDLANDAQTASATTSADAQLAELILSDLSKGKGQ